MQEFAAAFHFPQYERMPASIYPDTSGNGRRHFDLVSRVSGVCGQHLVMLRLIGSRVGGGALKSHTLFHPMMQSTKCSRVWASAFWFSCVCEVPPPFLVRMSHHDQSRLYTHVGTSQLGSSCLYLSKLTPVEEGWPWRSRLGMAVVRGPQLKVQPRGDGYFFDPRGKTP